MSAIPSRLRFDPSVIISAVVGFIVVFLLVAALYGPFEGSLAQLNQTVSTSVFAEVRSTIPGLIPLVPLLLLISIILGGVIMVARWISD